MVVLSKIESIKNCRNFINFQSNQELFRNEVVYAPNGSGKTNLSRLFNMLRNPNVDLEALKSKEADVFDDVEFNFKFHGETITQDNYKGDAWREKLDKILVFNNDYINKNINCPDFKQKELDGEISIKLGEEDIAISAAENEIKIQQEKIATQIAKLQDAFDRDIKKLKEKVYSAKERNIWNEFKFENIIDVGKGRVEKDRIDEICGLDLANARQVRESLLALGDEDKFQPCVKLYNIDLIKIGTMLERPISFPEEDMKITQSVAFIISFIQTYIRHGKSSSDALKDAIDKSQEKGCCLLCGRHLDDDASETFSEYKKFLAGEKSKYEQSLQDQNTSVGDLRDNILKLSNGQKEKIDRIGKLLKMKERWREYNNENILLELDALQEKIKNKISDSSREIAYDTVALQAMLETLSHQIESNNKLVNSLNRKMDDARDALSKARSNVGMKELQDFVNRHEAELSVINNSNAAIEKTTEELLELKAKAPKKEVRDNVCRLFNYFMEQRLGIEKYSARISKNQITITLKDFDISESMHIISEGEKTMIGLAYFLASSISTLTSENHFKEALFIIDDPISSVSYSNIFGICDMLSTFQNDIISTVWEAQSVENGQVIILTHNIQFFNIMRSQFLTKEKPKKKNSEEGEAEDMKPARDGYAILTPETITPIKIGHLLSDFESALLNIYEASQGGNNVGACNSMRRVCEILKHFYGIKGDFIAESLKKIFPYVAKENYDNLYKIFNYYSHGSANIIDGLPMDIIEGAIAEFVKIFSNEKSPFLDTWNTMVELSSNISASTNK